jgi:hypothetical protein
MYQIRVLPWVLRWLMAHERDARALRPGVFPRHRQLVDSVDAWLGSVWDSMAIQSSEQCYHS